MNRSLVLASLALLGASLFPSAAFAQSAPIPISLTEPRSATGTGRGSGISDPFYLDGPQYTVILNGDFSWQGTGPTPPTFCRGELHSLWGPEPPKMLFDGRLTGETLWNGQVFDVQPDTYYLRVYGCGNWVVQFMPLPAFVPPACAPACPVDEAPADAPADDQPAE